jgi:hypothetical protein
MYMNGKQVIRLRLNFLFPLAMASTWAKPIKGRQTSLLKKRSGNDDEGSLHSISVPRQIGCHCGNHLDSFA